jgi:hypothetical protein
MIFVPLMAQVRPCLEWLARHRDERADERIHYAAGHEAFRHVDSGGEITFATPSSITRFYGRSVDFILVAPDVVLTETLEARLGEAARLAGAQLVHHPEEENR